MKIIVLDNLNLNAFKKFCHRTEQDAEFQKNLKMRIGL